MNFNDLPKLVLERCKIEAKKQGVNLNLNRYCTASAYAGGFNWVETVDGQDFWENVLSHSNYNEFYLRYTLDPCETELNSENYRFMKRKKLDEAVWECYRELYKAATPSADFDKLLEEAPLNERGQKEIDFMAYEIEDHKMEEIIENILKKYKIKSEKLIRAFRFTIYLGASPKTKKHESKVS